MRENFDVNMFSPFSRERLWEETEGFDTRTNNKKHYCPEATLASFVTVSVEGCTHFIL